MRYHLSKLWLIPSKSPDNNLSPSSFNCIHQTNNIMGMDSNNELPEEKSLVFYTNSVNKRVIYTLINSGTSEWPLLCWQIPFHIIFSPKSEYFWAIIEFTFIILGRGTVKFNIRVDRKLRTITFNNAVYTSSLQSNLISVSKLLESGADTFFSVADNTVSVQILNGPILFSATKKEGLFYVDIKWDQCTVYFSQSP